MSYIVVLIPAIPGLILLLAPGVFIKETADSAENHRLHRKYRMIGGLLVAVAALYLVVKIAGR